MLKQRTLNPRVVGSSPTRVSPYFPHINLENQRLRGHDLNFRLSAIFPHFPRKTGKKAESLFAWSIGLVGTNQAARAFRSLSPHTPLRQAVEGDRFEKRKKKGLE